MQMKKGQQLRERWGDKPPCENPFFDKEYVYGSDTGDSVCTICGHYKDDHAPKVATIKKQEDNLD